MDVRKGWNRIVLILLFAGFFPAVFAQNRLLTRKVSLEIPSCSIELALREIGKAGAFRFSYDADLFASRKKPVELKADNTPVGSLLTELLGKDVVPKEIGNHVILVRNRTEAREKQPFSDIVVSGLIVNADGRQPLKEVTVYEVQNRRSAVSSGDGGYTLRIPTGKKIRGVAFCKAGFADTVIFIRQASEVRLSVILRPLESGWSYMIRPGAVSITATDSMAFVGWLVPHETMVNARNLEVITARTFQASIIPYIGSNWKVTGSVTNRFSLNILAGYTGGLKGIEIGGLGNVTRKNISGLQIGGLGNIVGGTGSGVQIGGLFNFDLGKFKGVQVGGLLNYTPDTLSGVQIAGLTNVVTGRVTGVQIAGLAGIVTRSSDAWQVSGLLNLTLRDARQAQIAGLMNYGRNLDGFQLAGLLNIVRNHNDGVQIAGLLNYATVVHGVQIGLINVSNTVERGIPIGLFSYVQQGYHLFELSGNEIFYGNVAFKSGTRSFYNFVQLGIGSDYKLQGSYGIGTIFTLKKKWSMNIDASAGFVYHPTDTIYHGLLLKFNPEVEYRFAKHFALFLGPAYNCFVFSKGQPSATSRGLSTYDFYFTSTENASVQMWLGGVLGIRI